MVKIKIFEIWGMLLRRGMFEKDEGKEVGFKVQKIELNAEKGFKNKEFLRN